MKPLRREDLYTQEGRRRRAAAFRQKSAEAVGVLMGADEEQQKPTEQQRMETEQDNLDADIMVAMMNMIDSDTSVNPLGNDEAITADDGYGTGV